MPRAPPSPPQSTAIALTKKQRRRPRFRSETLGIRAVNKAQRETKLYIGKRTIGRILRAMICERAAEFDSKVCRMSDAASLGLHTALEDELVHIFHTANDARLCDNDRPRLDNRHIRLAVRAADNVHRRSLYAQLEKDMPLSLKRPVHRRVFRPLVAAEPAKAAKSTGVDKVAKPAKVVKAAKSTTVDKATKPTKVAKATKSATVDKVVKPAKAATPVEATKPAKAATPVEATKPAKAAPTTKLTKSAVAAAAKVAKPVKPVTPAKTVKPVVKIAKPPKEDAQTRKERRIAEELRTQKDTALEAMRQAKASVIDEEVRAAAKRLERNNLLLQQATQQLAKTFNK